MPIKISNTKGFDNKTFDTYVPELTDSADIQNALELFYYGNSENGNATGDKSLHANLVDFDTRITSNTSGLSGHTGTSLDVHGVGAGNSIVGTGTTQTLTNKTITSPTITSPTISNPTFTISSAIAGPNLAPVGSIVMWANATVPSGWLECNGQSTTGYTALAAIVGATVPDMQGLVPAGFKTSDDAFGTLKSTGGSKTSTATHTHNLASHTHGDDHVHSGNTGGHSADHSHSSAIGFENAPTDIAGTGSQLIDLATGGFALGTSGASNDHTHGFTTNSKNEQGYGTTTSGPSDNTSGGSSAGATNGNLQPYFTLKFIIKY